jgi:hypothetical protein
MVIGSAAALAAAGIGIARLGSSSATAAVPDVPVERLDHGAVIGQYVAQVVGTLRSAEPAFEAVDHDGDGKLSQAEYSAIGKRVRDAPQLRSMPTCALPPVPAGAKLIFYGTSQADTISSVSIGGLDQETQLIDVTIEPGTTPLYLVLTSFQSMLWRLTGATDRVARVVVSSYHTERTARPVAVRSAPAVSYVMRPPPPPPDGPAASGVSGVAAERVTIAMSSCPPPFYVSGIDKQAIAAVRDSLGKSPDAVFINNSTHGVSLPTGTLTKADINLSPPPRFDAAMWRESVRYWPGGLATVDPRRVVAKARVKRYQVLPSQMGLAQWIGAGAIQAVPSDSFRTHDKFRIVRAIPHLPSGMGGAHSVTLILAKGVPLPPGDPVHSCVLSEETGKIIRPGARCPN